MEKLSVFSAGCKKS